MPPTMLQSPGISTSSRYEYGRLAYIIIRCKSTSLHLSTEQLWSDIRTTSRAESLVPVPGVVRQCVHQGMFQHSYGMAGLMRHVLGTMGDWSSSSRSGRAYSLVLTVVVNCLPGRLLYSISSVQWKLPPLLALPVDPSLDYIPTTTDEISCSVIISRYPSEKSPTSRYRLVYTPCCNGSLS